MPLLEAGKTYLFFSHTIKGQARNMPMLRRLMELGATLIDYEKITDEQNRRLLFFGRQAGQAGMIDTLWALGRKLEAEGTPSPFGGLLQTYHYTSLVEAKEEIAEVAHVIRTEGLPEPLVPLVCGFTGYGHVSQGAQEIFDLLPMEEIPPERFGAFLRQKNFSAHRVYKTVFREEHMVRPRSPRRLFELKDYYESPAEYEPLLEAFLPHLTILVNGIYWSPAFPRFLSRSFIRDLYAAPGQPRLRVVGDISCDIEGGVEVHPALDRSGRSGLCLRPGRGRRPLRVRGPRPGGHGRGQPAGRDSARVLGLLQPGLEGLPARPGQGRLRQR